MAEKIRVVTAAGTMDNTETVVVFNSASAINFQLLPSLGDSREFTMKNIGAGEVTLVPYDEDTIDGATSAILDKGNSFLLIDYVEETWTLASAGGEGGIAAAYYSVTDPGVSAATTAAIIDIYSGVIITTTTTGAAQTLASPTVTDISRTFTVVNNDTSTNSITVNSIEIYVGTSQTYLWDGSAWIDTEVGIVIGDCTTGITMSGDMTTGITMTGTITAYAIDIDSGVVRMGEQGTAVEVSSTYPFGLEVQTATDADIVPGATGSSAGIYSRYEVAVDQTTQCSHISMFGKLRVKKDLADGTHAGVFGYVEISGAGTVIGGIATTTTAAGHFAIESDASFELSTGHLNGICVDSSVNAGATITGSFVGVRVKKGTSATAWTTGINIEDSAATTGISIGTSTTGINFAGVTPTCIYVTGVGTTSSHVIDMIDGYTGSIIETGSYSSSPNKGVILDENNTRPVSFLFEDGNAQMSSGDVRGVLSRIAVMANQTGALSLTAIRGQCKVINGQDFDADYLVGVQGYIEFSGAVDIELNAADHAVAGLRSRVEIGGNTTITTADSYLTGLFVELNTTGAYTVTQTGILAGIVIEYTDQKADAWGHGIYIADNATDTGVTIGACTTGLNFSGATTTDISLQNSATITNAVNGTMILTEPTIQLVATTKLDVNGMLDVGDTLAGGASNGNIIKKTLQAGEAYTGTTAGLMVKSYGNGTATVPSGEFCAIYANLKGLHTDPGHNTSIISAHVHSSNTTTVWAGLWLYGDMTNGIKASGSTLTNLLDISEATAVTNLITLPAAGTDPVIANALVPAAAPDATTMGADACARVLVDGSPFYIALYNTLHA